MFESPAENRPPRRGPRQARIPRRAALRRRGWRFVMTRFASPRWWLAGATVVALAVGSLVAADRSSSAMATAASKFLASLTPEQRQQASFEFNSDERLRWHFIPTEMFPRKGLLIRDMNDAQRKLAHDLMKAALSQRGYLTASSILDPETVLGALAEGHRAPDGT